MYWPNHELEDHWYDKIPVKKILCFIAGVVFMLEMIYLGYHYGYEFGYKDGYNAGHHDACTTVTGMLDDAFSNYLK